VDATAGDGSITTGEDPPQLLDLPEELLPAALAACRSVELAHAAGACKALRCAVATVRAAHRSVSLDWLCHEHLRRRTVSHFGIGKSSWCVRMRDTLGYQDMAFPSTLHQALQPLTGLTELSLRGLRGVHEAATRALTSAKHLRVLDLAQTTVSTRGVVALKELPFLETLDLTYCALVSYAAVLELRAASPSVRLIRRQPSWMDGTFDTPWGEKHTYWPDGSFCFDRVGTAKGWVAQLRPHGGPRSSLHTCPSEGAADEDTFESAAASGRELLVTSHVEDRLIFIDAEGNHERLNGRVGVCLTPRNDGERHGEQSGEGEGGGERSGEGGGASDGMGGGERAGHCVLVAQSTDQPSPRRTACPALKHGYAEPAERQTVHSGVLMVSCMRVAPLEDGCVAPPPELTAELRAFCTTSRDRHVMAEMRAFFSCHVEDVAELVDEHEPSLASQYASSAYAASVNRLLDLT